MATKRGARRPKERQETQVLTIRMPKDLHAALRVYAAARGVSLNELVLGMVDKAWARVPERRECEKLAQS